MIITGTFFPVQRPELGVTAPETETETTATSDSKAAMGVDGPTDETLLARIDAFPWGGGVLAGGGAFLSAYLTLAAWVLVGPARLPGLLVGQLKYVGLLLYNAHGVLVIPETGPEVEALPINLLGQASLPIAYQAIPAVALLVAGSVFTYWYWPRMDTAGWLPTLATGAAVMLGYLAIALVGTFVFTIQQQGVVYHPDRPQVFLFVTGYGLIFSLVGSALGQAWLNTNTPDSE